MIKSVAVYKGEMDTASKVFEETDVIAITVETEQGNLTITGDDFKTLLFLYAREMHLLSRRDSSLIVAPRGFHHLEV